jgi:hypothetical protein
MAIHLERTTLVDDSRTFSAEELTDVWAWLDSFDLQPLRQRDGQQLVKPPFTFFHATFAFGERTYSVAKCSDGREVLGSVISGPSQASTAPKWTPASLWSEVSKRSGVFSNATLSGVEKLRKYC